MKPASRRERPEPIPEINNNYSLEMSIQQSFQDCSLLLARVPFNMYTHTLDTRPLRLRVYPLWGGSFSLRGRASLDRRANLNGRAILQGRISFCPPLEMVRAMQEQEGGERGRVGREGERKGRGNREDART